MGVVNLQQTGLIFRDLFDSSLLDPNWQLAPSDPARWSLSDAPDTLRLKHGDETLYALLPSLSEEKQFVLDVKNVYNPAADEDVGGLLVYANETDNIRLEEYFDSAKGVAQAYPWLRLVRDFNTYSAYWSEDGALWHYIGTQEFDQTAPMFGLFLSGMSGQDLDIESVTVCRTTSAIVDNLSRGVTVYLLDDANQVVRTQVCQTGQTHVSLDLTGLPQPFDGHFVITLADGVTQFTSSGPSPIWGGDSYLFQPNVDLYYLDDDAQEVHIQDNLETFLGYLNTTTAPGDTQTRTIKLLAKNRLTSGTFTNVAVQLTSYMGTDDYTRLVQLAPDVGGTPGTFSDKITLPDLTASSQTVAWLKLSRETDPAQYTPQVYFGLQVQAVYSY